METSSNVIINVTIKDVLDFIPEYSGENLCDYIHFKRGCEEAVDLLGCKHEYTLLKFLKSKLKGTVHLRYSLTVANYDSVSKFLKELEEDLPDFQCYSMWKNDIMHELYQVQYESVRDYGARFEEVLQCAIVALGDSDPEYTRDETVQSLQNDAMYFFIRNVISIRMVWFLSGKRFEVKRLKELINWAVSEERDLQKDSTCKICFENDHDDKDCVATERDYDYDIKMALRYYADHRTKAPEKPEKEDSDGFSFEKD